MSSTKANANLVNKADIQNALHLKGPAGSLAASVIMSVTGLNRINKDYPNYSAYTGRDFTQAAMRYYGISTDIHEDELAVIPKEGPFIIVSNHPFGGWDGIVLYDTIARVRPDFRIITNFILSLLPNLRDSFLSVNPFSSNKGLYSSFKGIREGKEHLAKGGCLGIFPAGEVATYHDGNKFPADKPWDGGIMKFIHTAGCPVIPVYFDGTNSRWFHFVGRIHPILRTVNLPKEVLRRHDSTVTMRVGKPIPAGEISKYDTPEWLGSYLRSRVYALEANTSDHRPLQQVSTQQAPIATPMSSMLLMSEIDRLDPLFEVSRYRCYLAASRQIPCLMREIAIRREESFRQVGEGTGKELDTDSFDEYYRHLILWDHVDHKLVGAYRLGIGSEIMQKYGVRGFYTHTLFSFSEEFIAKLPQAIELGRSFLCTEYKKEALPLMLLIKGLLYTVIRYSDTKYLFGPASITSWMPPFYRSLIIYSLRGFVQEKNLGLVAARTPFTYEFLRTDPKVLMEGKTSNVDFLDKYLQKLSNDHCRIPTLIKKYIKLNAQILDFNVDKEFNYCVDGMIFLDIDLVPRSEVEMLAKGSDDPEHLLERFTN